MHRRNRSETILGKIDRACADSFIAVKVLFKVVVNLIVFGFASLLIYAGLSLFVPDINFNQRDLLYKLLSFFIVPQYINTFIIWFCTIINSLLFA